MRTPNNSVAASLRSIPRRKDNSPPENDWAIGVDCMIFLCCSAEKDRLIIGMLRSDGSSLRNALPGSTRNQTEGLRFNSNPHPPTRDSSYYDARPQSEYPRIGFPHRERAQVPGCVEKHRRNCAAPRVHHDEGDDHRPRRQLDKERDERCPYCGVPKTTKSGRCHNAQAMPRISVPTFGPRRSINRGSAKPRHPGSSPKTTTN